MIRILRGFTSTQIAMPDMHPRYRLIRHGDCIFSGATTEFEMSTFGGPLSLRVMDRHPRQGEYVVTLEGRSHRMNSDDFLLINESQPYSVSMRASHAIESFAVYFSQAMVSDVCSGLQSAAADLMPDCQGRLASRLLYHGYFTYKGEVRLRVESLRRAIADPELDCDLELDRQMRELLAALLRVQGEFAECAENLEASRLSTRVELSKRIKKARDLLDSEFARQVSIEEIAVHACLSEFHLQRCFRSLTGLSLHEYQRMRRMNRATALLERHDMPVHEVAAAVGYAHHSSFARAYAQHWGRSPTASRRQT